MYFYIRINDKNTHWKVTTKCLLLLWKQIVNDKYVQYVANNVHITQSSVCMQPATCTACLHAWSEGVWKDHPWEVACRTAGSFPHPVPRAATGADPTEDPEACIICRWFWTPWGTSRGAAGPAGGSEGWIPYRPGGPDQSSGYRIW